jgi:flagellar biosynthesis chaperone FliJ
MSRTTADAVGSTPLEKAITEYQRAVDEWTAIVERRPESIAENRAWRIVQQHEQTLRTMVSTRVEAESNV